MNSNPVLDDGRLLLRGAEVAELLNCSRALAYRLMATGALPVIRPSAQTVRVPKRALLEWIEANTSAAAPAAERG